MFTNLDYESSEDYNDMTTNQMNQYVEGLSGTKNQPEEVDEISEKLTAPLETKTQENSNAILLEGGETFKTLVKKQIRAF